MATQHIRALQYNRKMYTDSEYKIMEIIATDIGFNDEPAYTGYRGIAERAGMDKDTVGSKVCTLADSGRLIVEKRGKYHYYSLPFDCPQKPSDEPEDKRDRQSDSQLSQLSQNDERLSQIEERLSQFEAQLSQLTALIVPMPQGANGTEVKKDKESKEREEARATPPEPMTEEEREERHSDDSPFSDESSSISGEEAWVLSFQLVDYWRIDILRMAPLRLYKNQEKNQAVYDNYHLPGAFLIKRVGLERAKQLVKTKRREMLAAGMTPIRMEPVCAQIMADFERAEMAQSNAVNPIGYKPQYPGGGGVY